MHFKLVMVLRIIVSVCAWVRACVRACVNVFTCICLGQYLY